VSRVIHFEIPASDPERASKFYQKVFGWKIEKWPGPTEYWLVNTGAEGTPGINGGLMKESWCSRRPTFPESATMPIARTPKEICSACYKPTKMQNDAPRMRERRLLKHHSCV